MRPSRSPSARLARPSVLPRKASGVWSRHDRRRERDRHRGGPAPRPGDVTGGAALVAGRAGADGCGAPASLFHHAHGRRLAGRPLLRARAHAVFRPGGPSALARLSRLHGRGATREARGRGRGGLVARRLRARFQPERVAVDGGRPRVEAGAARRAPGGAAGRRPRGTAVGLVAPVLARRNPDRKRAPWTARGLDRPLAVFAFDVRLPSRSAAPGGRPGRAARRDPPALRQPAAAAVRGRPTAPGLSGRPLDSACARLVCIRGGAAGGGVAGLAGRDGRRRVLRHGRPPAPRPLRELDRARARGWPLVLTARRFRPRPRGRRPGWVVAGVVPRARSGHRRLGRLDRRRWRSPPGHPGRTADVRLLDVSVPADDPGLQRRRPLALCPSARGRGLHGGWDGVARAPFRGARAGRSDGFRPGRGDSPPGSGASTRAASGRPVGPLPRGPPTSGEGRGHRHRRRAAREPPHRGIRARPSPCPREPSRDVRPGGGVRGGGAPRLLHLARSDRLLQSRGPWELWLYEHGGEPSARRPVCREGAAS
jgi:hypothetical protein